MTRLQLHSVTVDEQVGAEHATGDFLAVGAVADSLELRLPGEQESATAAQAFSLRHDEFTAFSTLVVCCYCILTCVSSNTPFA